MLDRIVTTRNRAHFPRRPQPLWSDWRMLCETIGERRAGTAEEARAAAFIAQRFAEAGLQEVRLEKFSCTSLRGVTTELHERNGRSWRRVAAAALVGAPGTPGGRAVAGEIAWLELPEGAARLRPGSFRGRILAVFGPLPTSLPLHRRLLAADPLAVVHVDDRLPFAWTKSDGVYPHWVKHHGMRPTITVPYMEAWRWRRDGVKELRLRIDVDQPAAVSQNVIAEIPGRDPRLPALVLTAHHDTQAANVGADDNASGVVCLLALAPVLARARPLRTIRLVSFGCEEQLSVGSDAYVRRHRITPADTGLAVNFDAVASPLGHFTMSVAGSANLARLATRQLARHGLDVAVHQEITPFSDHFPFNRAGVPSVWFMRTNFPGGRWQHHSRHDTLEHVSLAEVQRLLDAAAPFILRLAAQRQWRHGAALPAPQLALARRLGRELFG